MRFVPRDGVAVDNEIGFDLFAFVNEDLLQVGSIDYPSVRKAKEIGAFLYEDTKSASEA